MKGQFFVIGALLICALLFFGMGPAISLTAGGTADMGSLAGNLETELPHALNLGMNATRPLAILANFTEFSADAAGARGIDLACFWMVFAPQGGDVNVSAGNFMGSAVTFGINVSGTYKELYAADGSVNSTLFAVTGYKFNVTVTSGSGVMRAEMLHPKTSLYSFLSLERRGNLIRKEILA